MSRRRRLLLRPDVAATSGLAVWLFAAGGCNALWGVGDLAYGPSSASTASAGGSGSGGAGAAGGATASSSTTGGGGSGGDPLPGNCSEAVGSNSGAFRWSNALGDIDAQRPGGLGVDASGNLALAVNFVNDLNFGGGVLTAAGTNVTDVGVARLTAGGAHIWSTSFGSDAAEDAVELAVGPNGDVVVLGTHTNNFGVGALNVAGGAGQSCFVVRFEGQTGSPVFAEALLSAGSCEVGGVAIDAAGITYVAVSASGTITIDGNQLNAGSDRDVVLAALDPNGNRLWSRLLGGAGRDDARDLLVAPNDRLIVAGEFDSPQIALGMAAPPLDNEGLTDGFVVALRSVDGEPVWGVGVGGTGDADGSALALDCSGYLVAGGNFSGAMALAGASFDQPSEELWLARLAADGSVSSVLSFGGSGDDALLDVAVDAAGSVVLAGTYAGALSIGDSLPTTAGDDDGYLAKLDFSGQKLWAVPLGGAGSQTTDYLAIAADQSIVASGSFTVGIDFGGGNSLTNSGGTDTFVLTLER
jgi:hypothetical protein